MKIELDHYSEEKNLSITLDFDILTWWWKQNGAKYPILPAIARDVLVILITIVAFKSAFSIGDKILSPHCSRLHFSTLETLMCDKSWLWSTKNASKLLDSLLKYLIILF